MYSYNNRAYRKVFLKKIEKKLSKYLQDSKTRPIFALAKR